MSMDKLPKKEAPFKTQKNLEAGMFRADSLGGAVTEMEGKKMDMKTAKENIRRRREIFSGEFQRKEEEKLKEKARDLKIKNWWKHRESWKSARIGNRVGKISPSQDGFWRQRVEFPDGTFKLLENENS